MYDVIVCMLSRGSSVRRGVAPAAIVTSIVSPIARDSPSISAATMPESAAGVTTRVATSNFVAPSAYAASRSERGTASIASSVNEETIGMIITPITSPALSALKMIMSGKRYSWSRGVTNVNAK